MSEEIKKEAQDMELNIEDLDQVSGGGFLQDLVTNIHKDGHANELKTTLKTEGKAAAVQQCCGYYPVLCGFCTTAVTML